MFPVWIAVWAILASPPGDGTASDGAAAAPASTQADAQAPPAPLRQRVHTALRNTARLVRRDSSIDELSQAACELLPVYDELRRETSMVETDRNQLGGILRGRLKKIEKALTARMAESPPDTRTAVSVRIESAGPSTASSGSTSAGSQAGDQAENRGGRSVEDNGQALVELIQATIAPESWDVNGGQGTIIYYPPLRVLVVRQTSEVHGQVGDVLGQLHGQ